MKVKFDVVLYDNDVTEYRKSVLSWSVLQKDNLQRPDSMGELVLSEKSRMNRDGVYYCTHLKRINSETKKNVFVSPFVNSLGLCPIERVVAKGSWANNDNSGGFKAFWIQDALYVVVEALDNIKNTPMYLFPDKAYLERVNGGSLWKAMGDKCLADPVYLTRQTLSLPAGTYRVRYQSDRNHSFEGWIGGAPALDDYGVFVWKAD
jgi:hypothetical protein